MGMLSGLWVAVSSGLCPELRADSTVVFNEIQYHPTDREASLEWIELYNQMAVSMDLSGWRISGGVDHVFAEGTVIPGGGFLVIAANPAALRALGITHALGPFQGRLSNSGETLELRNNNQRLMDELAYGTDGEWPVASDGHGPTLAKIRETASTAPVGHWRASSQNGGTPGSPNFPTLSPGSLPVFVSANQSWDQRPAAPATSGIAWNKQDDGDSGWKTSSAPFFGGEAAAPSGAEVAIPTLFATGMSDSRKPLAPGSRDPHYTVVASAHAISPAPPAAAQVIEGHPAWLANDAGSMWLGPVNPGTTSVAAGTYRYRTEFDLSAFNPESAKLQIRTAADNRITSVLLNGRSVGLIYEGFQALSPVFPVSAGFIPGTNSLEFVWANDTTSPNPAGFRAQVQGTARSRFQPDSRLTPSVTQAAWFRTRFVVPPAWVNARLKLRTTYDDGAAFYLNGREIHRGNLPQGSLRPETPALTSRPGIPAPVEIVIAPGTLLSGTNFLAAEVHQAAGGLDDLWFEAELSVVDLPDPSQLGVRFNEVTATGPAFSLELANTTADSVPLDGFRILRTGSAQGAFSFPAGTILPPHGLLAVAASVLGFSPERDDHLVLSTSGGDAVIDALVIGSRPQARFPDGTGPWRFPVAPSPGRTNAVRLHHDVIFNEIFYRPPDGTRSGAWIELLNRSDSDIDVSGWAMTDGIRFRFPGGTLLKAREFLVLSENPEALRAENPGIRVMGPFSGQLSRSGERLVLSDADGNPADAMEYADAGRWPEDADGGGSSLELQDPWSDNASPEAWAASDESSRSAWVRHSYRTKAVSAPGPTLWNEWVMGLLDAGECLIDDLQVVESPGTATAVSLLKNGDFESGLTAWRSLGTHRLSRVIDDPDQPGNRVLRLVATGPTEHMHNHLETTLANNKSVVNGREYEVTFRARFLKGCPRLNTRLYFNRVAQTTALPRPTRHGTPGAANSRRVANLGPTFEFLKHSPAVPAAGQPVTVTAMATDADGLADVRLHWSVNGGAWQSKAAVVDGTGRVTAEIPGSSAGAVIQFYLSATDARGAVSWCPAVGPGSRALVGVADGQERLGSLHNLRVLMTAADRTLLYAETNVMSNEFLGATVIHDEQEVFYDVGVHLQGSQRGRLDAGRVGLTLRFPPDHLFRGVHAGISIDRSGGYTGVGGDQDEIVLKHALQHAGGLPGMYDDLVHVIPPRTDLTGTALLILAKYGDVFLDSQFEDGSDGDLFKLELIYYPTTTITGGREGIKRPQPDEVIGVDIGNLGNDPEVYRWFYLTENNRSTSTHAPIMALAKALSLSGSALEQESERLMAVDMWLRAVAFQSLFGLVDTYPYDNPHNFMIYFRPSDGRALPFLWDMDFAFGAAATSPLQRATGNIARLFNLPVNQRRYQAHLLDLITTTYNVQYLGPWIDHFGTLAGQNFGGIRSYVEQRSAYVRSRLPAATPFRVTAPSANPSLVNGSTGLIQGLAGLDLKELVVEGPEDTNRVRWINTSTWQATPVLRLGRNTVRIKGYDSKGTQVVNSEWSLTSTATDGGVDADRDGLPDAWELRYALNPGLDDRLLDADGDGQSNRDEFLAGTDPRDRESVLRLKCALSDAGASGGSARLQWDAKAGRSYTLLEASGTDPITWKRHTDIAAEAVDRPSQVILPASSPLDTGESRLFRLVTPSIP
jgi:hypothetical protein